MIPPLAISMTTIRMTTRMISSARDTGSPAKAVVGIARSLAPKIATGNVRINFRNGRKYPLTSRAARRHEVRAGKVAGSNPADLRKRDVAQPGRASPSKFPAFASGFAPRKRSSGAASDGLKPADCSPQDLTARENHRVLNSPAPSFELGNLPGSFGATPGDRQAT